MAWAARFSSSSIRSAAAARATRRAMATRAPTRLGILLWPAPRDGAIVWACAAAACACPISTRSALALRCALRPAAPRRDSRLRAPRGQWGYGVETSKGKDTPSGHWEIVGTPVAFDWGYFPQAIPTFPASLTSALIAEAKLPGILADRHASGTAIIAELGEAHMRTGKPICYTSADSVFQIAAHEQAFGLERLYEVCRIARRLCDPLAIGRVIARPFVGASPRRLRPHRQSQGFLDPAAARQSLAALRRGWARGRHDWQDRRHLRPSRYRQRGQGAATTTRTSI